MSDEPRVPLLEPDEARAIAAEHGVPEGLADLNVFRALLHRPRAAKALADLLLALLFGGRLDTRLRELAIMRIGWATASSYEWAQHWRIARDLSVPADDLLAVREWRAHEGFGSSERAVLAAVDEILEQGAASGPTVEACRVALGDEATVELVTAVAVWQLVSVVLRSLAVPLEDGVAEWPPDGQRPGGRTAP